MKNIAFYAGSFDPFTLGHLELVKQATNIFSKVIIGIGVNSEKERRFDKEEMQRAIIATLKEEKLDNCEVIIYDSYTYEAAFANNSNILIRGLRSETDYLYEEEIAKFNDQYGINTIYLRARNNANLSSSSVYNEFISNKDISSYVSNPIKKLMLKTVKGCLIKDKTKRNISIVL